MIIINITEEMLKEAKDNVKRYNDFNLFGGKYAQKFAGEVGRLALRQYLTENKFEFEEDTHIGSADDFDFIVHGQIVSLKTQLINFYPKDHWRCEVFIRQVENECDYHVFAKAWLKENKTFLVGCISKEEFDESSTKREKGEVLDDNINDWTVMETKRDVRIDQLHGLNELKP